MNGCHPVKIVKKSILFHKVGALYSLNGKILLESSAKCRIFAGCVKLVDFNYFWVYFFTVFFTQMKTGDNIAYD